MKKVSKKVEITKLNEDKFVSLNGKMLEKIKGGNMNSGSTDHACGGCSGSAGLLITTR
jgi:hypothetical protein